MLHKVANIIDIILILKIFKDYLLKGEQKGRQQKFQKAIQF